MNSNFTLHTYAYDLIIPWAMTIPKQHNVLRNTKYLIISDRLRSKWFQMKWFPFPLIDGLLFCCYFLFIIVLNWKVYVNCLFHSRNQLIIWRGIWSEHKWRWKRKRPEELLLLGSTCSFHFCYSRKHTMLII